MRWRRSWRSSAPIPTPQSWRRRRLGMRCARRAVHDPRRFNGCDPGRTTHSVKCRTVRGIRLYPDPVTRFAAPTVDFGDAHADDAGPRRDAPQAVARGRQWVIGVGSASAVYVVLAAGVLPAWLTAALGATLLVTVPTAQSFARRIVLNAAIVVGWSQVLWWVQWPFPLNHGALITALAAGVMTARLVTATDGRASVHALVPRLRPVDALIPVSVL